MSADAVGGRKMQKKRNHMQIVSQIVGYLGTAAAIMGFQVKKRELLLLCQIAANLLVSMSFIFLGQLAGGSICFIATGHTVMNYVLAKKKKAPAWWQNAIFLLLYLGASVYSWVTAERFLFPVDLFPFMCAMLFFLAITLTKAGRVRLCFLANASLWILYDVLGSTLAVANLVTHILVWTSNLISIIRYDVLAKKKV